MISPLRAPITFGTVNEIVTEKRSITMDMAYQLGKLFNMDHSTWIRPQEALDAWDTLVAHRKDYEKIGQSRR